MKPKAIWLISGGPMQVAAAREIKGRGYALILSDRSPKAMCRSLADCFVEIDTFDVPGHLAAANGLKETYDIAAVLTAAADCHFTVANTARHLGLHHLAPEISQCCRNKLATRQLLAAAGLTQPIFHAANNYAEACAIVAAHPTRAFVVKATDNSGSRGFSSVAPGQMLTEAQFNHALTAGTTGRIILESRLEPSPEEISEASVETVWQDGEMQWVNWVDRIFPRDLKFFPDLHLEQRLGAAVELGHINPAKHDAKIRLQVEEDIRTAGRALGMDRQPGGHILKADIFFSNAGPVILELTPRISGGWDSSGSSPARGANIVGGVIELALGHKITPEDWLKYFTFTTSTAVVISEVLDGAEDCIGRKFALAHGTATTTELIEQALGKLQKGEYLVPIL